MVAVLGRGDATALVFRYVHSLADSENAAGDSPDSFFQLGGRNLAWVSPPAQLYGGGEMDAGGYLPADAGSGAGASVGEKHNCVERRASRDDEGKMPSRLAGRGGGVT